MASTLVTFGSRLARQVEVGPFKISTAVFPARYVIPSHYHEWSCVSVILEGRFLQRFPGRTCDCDVGSVLAKPPGERHDDRWFDAPSRHLIIEIDPRRHGELGCSRVVAEEVWHARDGGAEVLARRMLREITARDQAAPLALEGLAFELLARIHRAREEDGRLDAAPSWLRRAREYLHDNFRSRVRLTDVAALAGVHPDHLSRTFSAVLGTTCGAYQRRLRVEAALAELAGTDAPFAAIAHRCGFSDQSHLTRAVKRATGVTPTEYRAAHSR